MINLFSVSILLMILSSFNFFLFKNKQAQRLHFIMNLLACIGFCLISLQVLMSGVPQLFELILKEPIGSVLFNIDPLSAVFLILISIISLISLPYAYSYIIKNELNLKKKFHLFSINIFLISMQLVVTSQNALFFLFVWEIMSISSLLLLSYHNEDKEVQKAGLLYFIWMHICVLFLVFAFALCSINSHNSLSFIDFRLFLQGHSSVNLILCLFFIGFGIKAGFFPFHSWLIQAHPASPSNISGLMSGLMLKIALYGMLRIIEILHPADFRLTIVFLAISLLSALWGIIYSVIQKDIKKVLAYSSVENIGIIGIGISLGLLGSQTSHPVLSGLGYLGALLHIINHSVYKTLLFFISGTVAKIAGTRDLNLLGGLSKNLGISTPLALLGCLAISALPPFNGFYSELLIFLALFSGIDGANPVYSLIFIITLTGLATVGVIALISFSRLYSFTFLGNSRSANDYSEKTSGLNIPLMVYGGLIILISTFPVFIIQSLQNAVGVITGIPLPQELGSSLLVIRQVSLSGLIFIGIFILIYGLRNILLSKKHIHYTKTWDCGFQAGNERMQYTGSSYSDSFYDLIQPLVRKKTRKDEIRSLFPDKIVNQSLYQDIIDNVFKRFLNPFAQKTLQLFENFQSGNTRNYLLYGIVFLIIVLLYVTFTG